MAGHALLLALGMSISDAATLTWVGTGTDNNILTGANWSGGLAPAASWDALVFTGSTRLAPTLSANRSVSSLTFSSSASSFVLGGTGIYTLTATGGIVNSSAGNVQTIGNALVMGVAQTWSSNAGSLVFNGNVNNSGYLLKVSSSGTTSINGIISGSGGLTKSGTGTLVLNGANTYSGLSTLGAGNVQIGSNSALGTGSIRFNSTSLNLSAAGGNRSLANAYTVDRNLLFSGANSLTLAGAGTLSASRALTVSGAGILTLSGTLAGSSRTLTKAGSGTMVLSGSNALSAIRLNAGTLYAGQASSLGGATLSLGTASFGAGNTLALSNAFTLSGNTTFVGSSDITFSSGTTLAASRALTFNGSAPVNFNGAISGFGYGITKAGTGTMSLGGSGANTFSGLTKVNDGQLILAKNTGTNAFAGTLEIGDGNGAAASAAVQLNAGNQIPDSSALAIYSDGQLRLQSFSETVGALTLFGGSVTGTGSLGLGGNLTFNGTNGATASIQSAVAMTAARTFLVNSNGLSGIDLAISGGISGAFPATKTGVGNLLLSGTNSFTGAYSANAGTTLIGNSSALGGAAANLGDVSGSNSASLLFDVTTGLSVANAITVRSGNTGTSSLGGWNTSGVNTFTGAVTLNKPVIFTAEAGGEVAFTGAVSGSGGFTKTGGGLIRLSGGNSSMGAMLISAGKLVLGANNALGSGALTVNGGILDFGANHSDSVGAVILDNGSPILGSGSSTLTSTGNFDLRSGTIQVALAGAGNLTKTTAGSVTLSGANIYTGATTISGGILVLSPTGSLGATATTVAASATLRNDGRIAGPVTVNGTLTGHGSFSGAVTINGSSHSPGNSPGIQTFSNGLAYASTSVVSWELADNTSDLGLAGSDYDQVRVTGAVLRVNAGASLNLLFNLAGSSVDFSNPFWTEDRNWKVVSVTGSGTADPGNASFVLGGISLDSLGHGYDSYGTFSTSVSGGNQLLSWTAVPEPRLAILLLVGGSFLLRRRRN